jgi:hypothetical protein
VRLVSGDFAEPRAGSSARSAFTTRACAIFGAAPGVGATGIAVRGATVGAVGEGGAEIDAAEIGGTARSSTAPRSANGRAGGHTGILLGLSSGTPIALTPAMPRK